MDRDANYVAVGTFVLLVIAMGVAFVLWYTEHQDKRQYARYEMYFQGSVSGLNDGSPVRFLGVNVGRVIRVALDPQERHRVMVLADIDVTAPIDGRTLATLSLQGVTGLLFIDLQQDHARTVPETLAQGLEYPVIRSTSSDFDRLLSALPTLAGHAEEMIEKLNAALSEENIQAFTDAIHNADKAAAQLPKTLDKIDVLSDELGRSALEVQQTAASLHGIASDATPQIHQIFDRTREAVENFATTSRQLDHFIAANEKGFARFTDQGLPEFERLLRESRAAAKDVRELSHSLKQNPSQLIFEPKDTGVEVRR
jgi:phospholipid/cholesterol/gamma-HCH transport system substrate-binding protein